jgi:hypothetical protein
MKKKKKNRGHGKGSAFERKIAKDIVKAFKEDFGIKQQDCWRSVLSGGHKMSAGDLRMSAAMEKLFPYAVECKFYKKIKLENFLTGNENSKEVDWLDQTCAGAEKSNGLKPLLVMKANNQKILAFRFVSPSKVTLKENVIVVAGVAWEVKLWTKFLKRAVLTAKAKVI